MQQAVDNANTFTAVRTKVNGVWGSWQVLPRLDIKVIPLKFVDGILPSKLAGDDDNKIFVIGNLIVLKAFIDKDSINRSTNNMSYSEKKLFYLPNKQLLSEKLLDR